MSVPKTHILLITTSSFGAEVIETLDAVHEAGTRALHVDTRASLVSGLEWLETGNVDVVLWEAATRESETDAGEPSGNESISLLSANKLRIPVVVLSASDREDGAVDAVRSGAKEFLSRAELSPARMLRSIECAIARAESARKPPAPDQRPLDDQWLFGEFELDESNLVLLERSRSVAIHLTPLRLLIYLIHHSDRTVSKLELLDHVWAGADVGEYAVSSALKDLRQALHDDGSHQRWIQTARGCGYRFVGQLRTH